MKKFLLLIMTIFSFRVLAETSPKNAYALAKEGKAVIIDVREADEVKGGMIDEAKWFPLSKISTNQNWKEDFKKVTEGKQIFLYCRSGNRSGKVMEILKENNIKSENIGGYETLKHELPIKR
ncbi:MAG: rhodanese-like domain-containing protein [Bacteriovoracaceae bacterium]|nr:rhodanese-like domain-containing protein [Bacteriovoracaceae bacterium]